jgi:site-specific recombinase XerD
VFDEATSELIHIETDEEAAFWDWACVETLRHSGVRIEELCELTHLSIRQYQRQNGEVIALLVIAPSKTDRERVIPISAELFQRQRGSTHAVISTATVLAMLKRRCADLAEHHPGFRTTQFTPHDVRRIFATELVNSGLPIHIGAALLGHLNIQTTRGYANPRELHQTGEKLQVAC